mmetsp:Transcript_2640/g.5576  ORF Transcript_2640/g.5576 Transcript_2640/m.5576 type:complete len:85 (+) Transcript_2640:1343-1597(+)
MKPEVLPASPLPITRCTENGTSPKLPPKDLLLITRCTEDGAILALNCEYKALTATTQKNLLIVKHCLCLVLHNKKIGIQGEAIQ